MKRHKTLNHYTVRLQGDKLLHTFPSIMLVLSLGLGSFVSGGCVAIPAVMLTSATVTAVGVVAEGEKLIQNTDTESSIMVRNDTNSDPYQGMACHTQGALLEEDPSGTHARQKAQDHCDADLAEPKAMGDPDSPKT